MMFRIKFLLFIAMSVLSFGANAQLAGYAIVCTEESLETIVTNSRHNIHFTFNRDGTYKNDATAQAFMLQCVTNLQGARVMIQNARVPNLTNLGMSINMINILRSSERITDLRVPNQKLIFSDYVPIFQNVRFQDLNPYVPGAIPTIIAYEYTSQRDNRFPAPHDQVFRDPIAVWSATAGGGLFTKIKGSPLPPSVVSNILITPTISVSSELICPPERITISQSDSVINFGRFSSNAFDNGQNAAKSFTIAGMRNTGLVNAACPTSDVVNMTLSLVNGGRLNSRQNGILIEGNENLQIRLAKASSQSNYIEFNTPQKLFELTQSRPSSSESIVVTLGKVSNREPINTGVIDATIKLVWEHP